MHVKCQLLITTDKYMIIFESLESYDTYPKAHTFCGASSQSLQSQASDLTWRNPGMGLPVRRPFHTHEHTHLFLFQTLYVEGFFLPASFPDVPQLSHKPHHLSWPLSAVHTFWCQFHDHPSLAQASWLPLCLPLVSLTPHSHSIVWGSEMSPEGPGYQTPHKHGKRPHTPEENSLLRLNYTQMLWRGASMQKQSISSFKSWTRFTAQNSLPTCNGFR